jgi:hypothetical protein
MTARLDCSKVSFKPDDFSHQLKIANLQYSTFSNQKEEEIKYKIMRKKFDCLSLLVYIFEFQ